MLSYLTGSVTQGSNDAFAEAEIATALSGINTISFRVGEIYFGFAAAGTSGATYEAALTRRSKTAFPTVDDRDVIAIWRFSMAFTTSGLAVVPLITRYTFTEDDDLRIVEDPLYLQVDSASSSAQNVLRCRIGYNRVNISQVDRLTLLTNSLAD